VSYANDDHNAAIAEVFVQAYEAWAVPIIVFNEAHEPNKVSHRSEVATIGATPETSPCSRTTARRYHIDAQRARNRCVHEPALTARCLDESPNKSVLKTYDVDVHDIRILMPARHLSQHGKAIADEAGVPRRLIRLWPMATTLPS
jgi:hypothetical protein